MFLARITLAQCLAWPALALLCASTLSAAEMAEAIAPRAVEEPVTVYLADGRVVTGTVDAKTDAQHLWLRRTAEQFDLVSGYRWELVLEGRTQERTLDHAQLQVWTASRKLPGRRFAEIAPKPSGEFQMVSATTPAAPPLPPVKTLVVDAELAQWDKDAQTEGLRIMVCPLDAYGNIVPVEGHIEFTLVVQRERVRPGKGYAGEPRFVEGDRLTFPVRREHFSAGPAFYELPFDRWHPDYEVTLANQGLLHARLSVPGQGVFEASDAQVCLRELSRFRDQLQYYTPGRYLPVENPSRDGR